MAIEHIIGIKELEKYLNTRFSKNMRDRIIAAGLRYKNITQEERDEYLLDVISTLMEDDIITAGEHRLPQWENGWSENLETFKTVRRIESIIPRYHSKFPLVRWKQNIIRPTTEHFEYNMLSIVVDWVFDSYLRNADTIFEFGCGPGHHLLRARQFNPKARLVGLDWTKASQKIILGIINSGIETNIEGHNFNFFKPNNNLNIPPNSGVYTVAALEQVGDRFESFLQFLLRKNPVICVHLEPIDELLDPRNLLDKLSIIYFHKRNYLKGFLSRLHELQDKGIITIHREQRTYIGSYFIEGHSLIVWSPTRK
jgi:hypothetical protein